MTQIKLSIVGASVLAMGLVLGGCTSAGPYITNISSDGRGNLIIEKNTVHFNSFTGTVSSGANPTTQTVQVIALTRN